MTPPTPQTPTAAAAKISLYPYQLQMVIEVSMHYQAGVQGIMLRCPTGGGKTRTGSYIVNRYVPTQRHVIWLVDQEELLDQAAMTFASFGIHHHLICAAKTERAIKAHQFMELGRSFVKQGSFAVIASVQTLVRRIRDGLMSWLDVFQIIADEADLSLASTWREVIGYWPKARLLGLTATPIRMDRQSFLRSEGGLYDVMVCGPSEAELIDMGFLSRYVAYNPDTHLVEGVADLSKLKGGDYDPAELEKELDAPRVYGDVVEHYRNYSHGKPAIAFCPTVASAEKFAQAFRDAGYRAQALDGMTEDGIRRKAVKQLGAGEIDVLTGVGLLVKGVDIPYATTAIWLRRTKSLRIFMQGTGRVLRTHKDKEHAILLDCVGVIDELRWLPRFEREWSLSPPERKSRKASAANDNEADVMVRRCPKCAAMHEPLPQCPVCGHIYPVREAREMQQVDAGLKLIDQAEEERLRRQRRAMQGSAQTVDELMATMGMGRARAQKIVQAREAKAVMIGGIMDTLEVFKAGGGNVFKTFGVTLGAIRSMKPKELKELRARIDAQVLAASSEAA